MVMLDALVSAARFPSVRYPDPVEAVDPPLRPPVVDWAWPDTARLIARTRVVVVMIVFMG
ncbi:hypothetical protein GCM10028818_50510 [Spirosoma horti]